MKRENEEYFLIDEEAQNLFGIGDGLSSPEKRLLFAICERAVRDLFSSVKEEHDTAIAWLQDITGNAPFSFPWICEELDLELEQLASKIWSLYSIGKNARNASREIYSLIDKNNSSSEAEKLKQAA